MDILVFYKALSHLYQTHIKPAKQRRKMGVRAALGYGVSAMHAIQRRTVLLQMVVSQTQKSMAKRVQRSRFVPTLLGTARALCLMGSSIFAFDAVLANQELVTDDEYQYEYEGNWGLHSVRANAAYALELTGKGIKVGVFDEATDLTHIELREMGHIAIDTYFVSGPDGQKTLHSNGGLPVIDMRLIDFNSAEASIWMQQNEIYSERLKKYHPEWREYANEYIWANFLLKKGYVQVYPNSLVMGLRQMENHGTAVSGVIAAKRDGKLMHGVAPESTLVTISKANQLNPQAQPTDIAHNLEFVGNPNSAAHYAAVIDRFRDEGVSVINYSFGLTPAAPLTFDGLLEDNRAFGEEMKAFAKAADYGILSIWAMGNEGPLAYAGVTEALPYFYPEIEPFWLVVAATDRDGKITDFSTRCGIAKDWCLAAPGDYLFAPTVVTPQEGVPEQEGVYVNGNYQAQSGTSLSAPMASGAFALLKQRFPYMGNDQIREVMLTTATDIGRPGVDEVYGHGLLNLESAVQGVKRFRKDFHAILPAGVEDHWSHDIDGEGGLVKRGEGALTLTGQNAYQGVTYVQAGQLNVNGQINGSAALVVETGAWLRGTGRVASPARIAGGFAPGQSAGTFYFAAPVTLTSTGQTQLDIDGYNTGNGAGNYSRTVVTGVGNTFTLGGVLQPILRGITGSATNTFVPNKGDRFAGVLSTEAEFLGGFSRLVQPDGLALGTRFDVLFNEGKADLAVSATTLPGSVLGDNAAAGAEILNALRDHPLALRPGSYNTWLGQALNGNPHDPTYRALGGQIYADTLAMGITYQDQLGQVLFDRMAGFAGGKEAQTSSYSLWIQAPYESRTYTAELGRLDTKVRFGGILLGLDRTWDRLRIGGAVGIANGYVRQDIARADADLNGASFTMYGRYALGDASENSPYLVGRVSYARFHAKTDRALSAFNTQLSSRARLHHTTAELGIGTTLLAQQWRLNPELSMRFTQSQHGQINEAGMGGDSFALTLDARAIHTAYAIAQLRASRAFAFKKGEISPQLIVGVQQALRSASTSQAQLKALGNTINQNAAVNDDTLLRLGLGVQVQQESLMATLGVNVTRSMTKPFSKSTQGLGAAMQLVWGW